MISLLSGLWLSYCIHPCNPIQSKSSREVQEMRSLRGCSVTAAGRQRTLRFPPYTYPVAVCSLQVRCCSHLGEIGSRKQLHVSRIAGGAPRGRRCSVMAYRYRAMSGSPVGRLGGTGSCGDTTIDRVPEDVNVNDIVVCV